MARQNGDIKSLAEMFRTLADGTRLRILLTLQDDEHNVTQLCRKLRMPQPNVSRHLSILRNSGFVVNRREGKEVFYSINDYHTDQVAGKMDRLLKKASVVRIGPVVMGLSRQR